MYVNYLKFFVASLVRIPVTGFADDFAAIYYRKSNGIQASTWSHFFVS